MVKVPKLETASPLYSVAELNVVQRQSMQHPKRWDNLLHYYRNYGLDLVSWLGGLNERATGAKVLVVGIGQQEVTCELINKFQNVNILYVDPTQQLFGGENILTTNVFTDKLRELTKCHEPEFLDGIIDLNCCRYSAYQWHLFKSLANTLKPDCKILVELVQPLFQIQDDGRRAILEYPQIEHTLNKLHPYTDQKLFKVAQGEHSHLTFVLFSKRHSGVLKVNFRHEQITHSEVLKIRARTAGSLLARRVNPARFATIIEQIGEEG